ncbi:MAG: penicillin-binding protein 2 [Candidatus Omnitrophota bacterium]
MFRERIIYFIVTLICLVLVFGLFNLQVVKGKRYKDLSDSNSIRLISKQGARGKILDRSGEVIVDSQLFFDAIVLPQDVSSLDRELKIVADVLERDPLELKKIYRAGFIAPAVPVTLAKNINIKKAISLEELKPELAGIVIQPRPARRYPYAGLASHVIGYVNEIDRWRLTQLQDYGYKTKDLVGFGGVEEKYDYYLRGEAGGLSLQVNHRGKSVRVLGFESPSSGKDIQLTLNLKAQKIAESVLAGRKGCIIIMDPYSGEIIVMASAPGFNPESFVNKSNSTIAGYFNDPGAPLINRAITGAYPAGSIFKVIVATGALETKKINSSTSFLCQGFILVGKQEFKCWSTHGLQDLIGALAHSCNVFFYKAGFLTGAPALHEYSLRFGLAKTSGCELPYEAAGYIPSPLLRKIKRFKNWFDGDTANFSIGQGDVLVTPLQMARMMAVFANNGYLVTPCIIKSIAGEDILTKQKKAVNLHLKNSTIDYVRQGLKAVVANPEGTGHVLADLSVTVAGKTGTAQAPPGQPHAWFTGFFPYNEPRFVICVFLEHGGPGYYSCVAAKQVIEEMIKEGLI